MKKLMSIVIVAAVFAVSLMMNVSAQSIYFKGQVNGEAKGVTVMVTQTGADLNNLKAEDIVYMNQARVSENGRFTLKLPLPTEGLEIHTNADNHIFSDSSKDTIYLSENGNDSNDGLSEEAPKKTFAGVYAMLDNVREIVLMTDITLSLPADEYEGTLVIKGHTGSEKLSLGGMSLKGNLKLDNLVLNNIYSVDSYIYANGYSFEAGENLTSIGRFTVYGGKKGESVESTDLKLFGGQYRYIIAGGDNGKVTGDTNVVVGGNVNPYDGVDDSDKTTLSPTYVYGGSNAASVEGTTNITISGNATVYTVSGAGNGEKGSVCSTNINISGGNIVNVYGGSLNNGADLGDCDTNIIMTGGIVESIFGGCQSKEMTGTTRISISGGEVTRRIYSGCYNETGLIFWDSDCYVKGTTIVELYPGASLITGKNLSSSNKANSGIFAGSRTKNSHSSEKNYMIFKDDAYDIYASVVGEQVSGSTFKNYADYTLDTGKGGKVTLDDSTSTLECIPDMGRGVLVNNVRCKSKKVVLTEGFTSVEFDGITGATLEKNQNGVSGEVQMMLSENATLVAAVYDNQTNNLIGVQTATYVPGSDNHDVNIDCSFEQGRTYRVQLFVWKDMKTVVPFSTAYVIDLK